MLYFNLLSSDTEGTDSKYNMFFSKLNSHSDSKLLKIYTPHGPLKSKQGVKLTKKLAFHFRENGTKHCFCYGHNKIMLLALI